MVLSSCRLGSALRLGQRRANYKGIQMETVLGFDGLLNFRFMRFGNPKTESSV